MVFRTIGLPQDFVFKSTRRSPEAMAWLENVHDCARQVGFVVPQLVESRRGRLIENGWMCEMFIEGQHIDVVELPEIKPQLLQFHDAASDLAQRPGFLSSLALRHYDSGGDIDLDRMPKDVVRKCRDAWDVVAGRQEGIIHGDLNTGNVLKTSDGAFALLDWDESRRDLILFDTGHLAADDDAGAHARLAWEIACCWIIEPDRARALADQL